MFMQNLKEHGNDFVMLRASMLPGCNRRLVKGEGEKWLEMDSKLKGLVSEVSRAEGEEQARQDLRIIDLSLHKLKLFN